MAFEDYKPKDGLFHSAFVGLANFKQLFSDVTFVRVIRNTLAMGCDQPGGNLYHGDCVCYSFK